MNPHTLELPDDLSRKVAAAARKLGVSRERFVREAVEARLREKRAAAPPSLYDLSRDLCGSVKGGPHDLARNKAHRKGYGSWRR